MTQHKLTFLFATHCLCELHQPMKFQDSKAKTQILLTVDNSYKVNVRVLSLV